MKHYILTYEGKIKRVSDLENCGDYLLAADKKRHLKYKLIWYIRTGIQFKIKERDKNEK